MVAPGQLVSVLRVEFLPPVFLEFPVQLLDILSGDLRHWLVSQVGLDVALDISPVAFQSGGSHRGVSVLLQPAVQPLAQGHFTVLVQVHIPVFLDILMELFQQLLLRLGG